MSNYIKTQKLLRSYLEVFDNEVSLSTFWGAHYGKAQAEFWIPNNAVVNKKYHFAIILLSKIYYLIALIWLFILPLMFVLEYIRWGRKITRTNKTEYKDVFLYSSLGSNFNFINTSDESYPSVGITLPWVRVRNYPECIPLVDIRTLSKQKIFLKSCGLAYLATLKILFDTHRIRRVLYTYTAMKWFFVLLTLEKFKFDSIWVANHYDRWAILLDLLNTNTRYMIQHGTMVDKSRPVPAIYKMPQKLKSSWRLYLYTREEYQVFCDSIFSTPPALKLFDLKLNLNKDLYADTKSILIIGNPRLQDNLIKLIEALRHMLDYPCVIVYRPHPREKRDRLTDIEGKLDVIIDGNLREIPKTTIVLSYGSSIDELLREYYAANIISIDVSKNFNANKLASLIINELG